MSAKDVIQARVDERLKRDFELAAMQRGMSASKVLRELMVEFVDREKKRRNRRVKMLETLDRSAADRIILLDPGAFSERVVRR